MSGSIVAGEMKSLVAQMSAVFAPMFANIPNWPKSVHHEFQAGMHRFMAHMTETNFRSLGRWRDCFRVVLIPSSPLTPRPP